MSSRFIMPFADVGSGIKPSSGAKLFFFEVDGVTPKDTFSDQLSTPTANTNPVIADSSGVFGDIYINETYKVTLQDKNGSQIFGLAQIDEFSTESGAISKALGLVVDFSTLNSAVIETNVLRMYDGAAINLEERTTGNGGGGMWDVVLSSTVTENTFDIVQCTGVSTLSLVLRVEEFIFADQVGVTYDGSTDDSGAWNRCIALYKSTKLKIICQSGITACESTILYSTVGDGITQGLILEGPGTKNLTFLNKVTAGGEMFKLTSGTSGSDFQFGGSLSGFRIEQSGSGSNSHGISYEGTWRQKFISIEASDLNGSFIKAVNTLGDVDSSAFVTMDDVRANDCAGPAYDSEGSMGGLAAHRLSNYLFENCGTAEANIVLDGVGNFRIEKSTIVGNPVGPKYLATQTGIHIKGTNVFPSNIDILEGEFGNSLQRVILIDKVLRCRLGGFRIVKRAGEATLTTGIEIADGTSTAQHVTIDPIVVALDDNTPVTTLFKIGTGIDDNLTIKAPVLNSFAAGSTYIAFTGTAKDKASYIENSDGRVLFDKALLRTSIVEATATTLTPDLLTANWYIYRISDNAAYTLNPPTNGAADGATFEISIQNISGSVTPTMTFASGIQAGGYTDPGIGLTTTATYRYNSADLAWRVAGGGWSTPAT